MKRTYEEWLKYYENATKEQVIEDTMHDMEEIDRLNNIIDELEKWCNNGIKNGIHIAYEQELDYEDVLDKLKELKENK